MIKLEFRKNKKFAIVEHKFKILILKQISVKN